VDDPELTRLERNVVEKCVTLVAVFEAAMKKDPTLLEWLKSDAPGAVKMRGLRARVKAYLAVCPAA